MDKFSKLITWRNGYLISATFITLHLSLSIWRDDWVWFQRSGSLITLMGILLTGRIIFRLKGASKPILYTTKILGSTSDGRLITQDPPERIESKRQNKLDEASLFHGQILLIIGCLIWGYGDLINKL